MSISAVILTQLFNLGLIFSVIFCIVTAMNLPRVMGFLKLLEAKVSPVLPIFGMTYRPAPVAVVGMVMGLGFGGALLIRETAHGSMAKRGGIPVGRLLFSLIVVFGINQLMSRVFSIRDRAINR